MMNRRELLAVIGSTCAALSASRPHSREEITDVYVRDDEPEGFQTDFETRTIKRFAAYQRGSLVGTNAHGEKAVQHFMVEGRDVVGEVLSRYPHAKVHRRLSESDLIGLASGVI
jgi:hypothetical protein